MTANRLQYNRWHRRICTLSVQLYFYVTSANLVFVSYKIISDNFIIKCLAYSIINSMQFYVFFIFCVYTFLFNLGKHVNKYEKILFFLLYLTLVTSGIIDPFLCCHLLNLIIYLDVSKYLQIKQQLKIDIKVAFKMNGKLREKSLKVQF